MGEFARIKEQANLKEYAEDVLQKSRGGYYCCPACGSGTTGRANSDGALSIKGDTWKCFSCDEGGDIFDLAGTIHGTDDKREQLEHVAAWAGVSLDDGGQAKQRPKPERSPRKQPDHLEGQKSEAAYIAKAQAAFWEHPEALAYWRSRGFTEKEAEAFGVGWDCSHNAGWKTKAGEWAKGARLVLPWDGSTYYHIDRAAAQDAEQGKYDKPKSDKVGRQPLYNPDALKAPVFFIVEGVLDALAVGAFDYEAVALGGTGIRQAVEEMNARGVSGVAVCLLDGDSPGIEANGKLCDELEAAGIPHIEAVVPGHKDAAEALAANRESLGDFLNETYEKARAKAAALEAEEYARTMRAFRVHNPMDVAAGIYALEDAAEPVPTGFERLDEALGGGLAPGLYGLGAVSSLGKTTIAVQIADHIAASGRGVVFFTIEQSARELVAKSLSRYVARIHPKYAGFTANDICSPTKRAYWGEAFNAALLDACNAYAAEVAPNLGIQEGRRQPSVADVEAVARAWGRQHGKPPVVVIDYLQLLAAPSERDTDKQAVDKNVMSLRQMARDLQTPVVVISSLNRSSYSEGVTLDAWKESGAIEYGADVLLGLQPEGTDERLDDTAATKQRREGQKIYRENKQATERACELKIIKNRHGRAEVKIPLTFKTLRSTFEEKEESAAPERRVL